MTSLRAPDGAQRLESGGPVAEVTGLHVSFDVAGGSVAALRGVDLSIARGEIVAIVGESGSGKSVLGSCLLGLPPTSRRTHVEGSVVVAGVDMLHGPEARRRLTRRLHLGAVFQDPLTSLNPTMRIEQQLREAGASTDRALRNLREASVPQPERRLLQWPHELSGGLRQRVMLAMALGGDDKRRRDERSEGGIDGPALIVADEPTTALDVSVQAQIVVLFDRLRREHDCAVLLITHDLGVAASVADRIIVLYAGRVCEEGDAAGILACPRHPYTAALLRSRLSLDDESDVRPIAGTPPDPLSLPSGCAFAPRCDRADTRCSDEPPLIAPIPNSAASSTHLAACHHLLGHGPIAESPVAVRDRGPGRPGGTGDDAAVPALQLRSVAKSFGVPGGRRSERLRAVVDVDLRVAPTGAVALVGESGCGKTTLLRIACGLLAPDAGDVTWGEGVRPQLVYQDAGSSLTPWLSVGRQVAERLPRSGEGSRRERASALLQQVGLDRRVARSRPRELSGGQRQRAAIARALASDPRLLVCDEPVSALDASMAVRVLDLLAELRETLGVALLVVTHDLAAARYVADDVAVMYLGRIVEWAAATDIFTDPLHPYTQGLRAASPTTEPGRLAPTLQGEHPTQIGEPAGCVFVSRCAQAEERCHGEPQVLSIARPGRLVACEPARRRARSAV